MRLISDELLEAQVRRLKRENGKLRGALREALDLFDHEFCHRDGSVVTDHTTGEPYNAGGRWVWRARQAMKRTYRRAR